MDHLTKELLRDGQRQCCYYDYEYDEPCNEGTVPTPGECSYCWRHGGRRRVVSVLPPKVGEDWWMDVV